MCLFELLFSQGIYPGVGFLGHVVVLFRVSWAISVLYSIVVVSVCISPKKARWLPFASFFSFLLPIDSHCFLAHKEGNYYQKFQSFHLLHHLRELSNWDWDRLVSIPRALQKGLIDSVWIRCLLPVQSSVAREQGHVYKLGVWKPTPMYLGWFPKSFLELSTVDYFNNKNEDVGQ